LERYAELGAELDGITDKGAQIQKVGEHGITPDAWAAAVSGWTARMQDMSLMGQVATRYMQLYNQALAAKKGTASISFEEFCAVSAGIQVFGYEAAMAHYQISMGDWTTISSHWMTELSRDPMNLAVRKNQLQEQEAARLRSGGQPQPVSVQRSGPGAPVAGGAAAFDPNAHAAMQMQAAAANQASWMAYSAEVMNRPEVQAAVKMAGAQNVMGGGSELIVGRKVMVAWSDRNKYPATIIQVASGQSQIVFPNGQNMWVGNEHLTPA
jgi:hypothetical protein